MTRRRVERAVGVDDGYTPVPNELKAKPKMAIDAISSPTRIPMIRPAERPAPSSLLVPARRRRHPVTPAGGATAWWPFWRVDCGSGHPNSHADRVQRTAPDRGL